MRVSCMQRGGWHSCGLCQLSCGAPPVLAQRERIVCGQEKQRPAKAEEVVRLYDVLLGHAKELAEVGRQVAGAAGEALLDECAAKVNPRATCFTAASALFRKV